MVMEQTSKSLLPVTPERGSTGVNDWEFREGDTFTIDGNRRIIIPKHGRLVSAIPSNMRHVAFLDDISTGFNFTGTWADYYRQNGRDFKPAPTDPVADSWAGPYYLSKASLVDLEAEVAKRKAEEAGHLLECWERSNGGNQYHTIVDDRSDNWAKEIVPFMGHFEVAGYKVEVTITGTNKTWLYKRKP
jgi:hypothetical protein